MAIGKCGDDAHDRDEVVREHHGGFLVLGIVEPDTPADVIEEVPEAYDHGADFVDTGLSTCWDPKTNK